MILADAYVRGGTSASTSFGADSEIDRQVQRRSLQYLREAYMKLDISDVQPGDTVRLRLFGRLSDTRAATRHDERLRRDQHELGAKRA